MFTFGREHEKKCAVQYLRDANESQRIVAVVDAVHDVLERRVQPEAVRSAFIDAFSQGGTGVWEQAGSWLRKLAADLPELDSMWYELSESSDGKVRFRVACLLNDLPQELALELGQKLRVDKHKKTREMALARLEEIGA